MSTDHIFTISCDLGGFHFEALASITDVMVDELSPVRSLAADCPISTFFKHSHLSVFHNYVVVCKTLRSFQQFKSIHHKVSNYDGQRLTLKVSPIKPDAAVINYVT